MPVTVDLVALGLIAHAVGDYLLQSDWMAVEKTDSWWAAWAHGASYGLPFAGLLGWYAGLTVPVVIALAVIVASHALIDRYRLARHVVWLKNQIAPREWRHGWCDHVSATGYHRPIANADMPDGRRWTPACDQQAKPVWMGVWLMIIADNTLHVTINSVALLLAVGTVGGR